MNNNYSKIDGVMTENINSDDITLKKVKLDNCPKCNNYIKEDFIYCKACGNNLEEIYTSENKIYSDNKFNYKDILNYLNMPKTFITSITAIGIIFIISVLLKGIVSNYIPEYSEVINPIHIMLGLNLGSVTTYSSSMMGLTGSELNLGIIIMAIIPVVILSICNIIFNKKDIKNGKDAFRTSLGIGVSYGIILGILAMLSKTKVSYNYGMMHYGYAMQFSFNFLNTILKGFAIGFLPSFILLYKKKYEDENMYLGILKRAINMVLTGYIITLVILFIITLSDNSYLYNFGVSTHLNIFELILILSQLAVYIWSFGNFVPVTVGGKELSFLSLLNSSLNLTTILLLASMILLSILIIIIFSSKLEAKYNKKQGIKPVILFSFYYAIIIGILSIMTKVTLGGNVDLLGFSSYNSTLSMGFGLISAMLISFIYCLLVSLTGYKLNTFN